MSKEVQQELQKTHHASQEKYVYYLLSIGASAIALALYRTKDLHISYTQIPLATAVVLWGFSFYFGISHITKINTIIMDNFNLFEIKKGKVDFIGNNPQHIEIGIEKLKEIMESKNVEAIKLYKGQLYCLILGAIGFIIWHIIEMFFKN